MGLGSENSNTQYRRYPLKWRKVDREEKEIDDRAGFYREQEKEEDGRKARR